MFWQQLGKHVVTQLCKLHMNQYMHLLLRKSSLNCSLLIYCSPVANWHLLMTDAHRFCQTNHYCAVCKSTLHDIIQRINLEIAPAFWMQYKRWMKQFSAMPNLSVPKPPTEHQAHVTPCTFTMSVACAPSKPLMD